MNYCLLAVEGSHDQAAIAKLLELSGFEKFKGDHKQLDPFWEGFIPKYPKNNNLYKRLDMPSILTSQTHSVAIYVGEGSKLTENIVLIATTHEQYVKDIQAFGLIVDADKKQPEKVAEEKAKSLKAVFPMISKVPETITLGPPRTGIYVLPDNEKEGVLDSILIECASIVYPDHRKAAENFIDSLDDVHTKHFGPFDKEKALIASIVSILKPGMGNTPSIAQNQWISNQTVDAVKDIARLHKFIKDLLGLS